MSKANDLNKINDMVENSASPSEGILHKALKKWVAIENYDSGVPVSAFEFEKKFKYEDEMGRLYKHTTADVFINNADTETVILVGNYLIEFTKIFVPCLIGIGLIVYCYDTYRNHVKG